jgi:hypothetical protein
MTEHFYKKIELVGTSDTSTEDAIEHAIARASKTIRNIKWFEVVETRGRIEGGKVAQWQVTVKVSFDVEG